MEHLHTQDLTCFHYFVSIHWAALIKPTEVLFCVCVAEKEKWNDGAERRLQRGPAGRSGKINDKSTLVWLRADSTYTHQQTRTQPLVGPVLSARLFVKRTDWSRVTVLCNKCLIQDSQGSYLKKNFICNSFGLYYSYTDFDLVLFMASDFIIKITIERNNLWRINCFSNYLVDFTTGGQGCKIKITSLKSNNEPQIIYSEWIINSPHSAFSRCLVVRRRWRDCKVLARADGEVWYLI